MLASRNKFGNFPIHDAAVRCRPWYTELGRPLWELVETDGRRAEGGAGGQSLKHEVYKATVGCWLERVGMTILSLNRMIYNRKMWRGNIDFIVSKVRKNPHLLRRSDREGSTLLHAAATAWRGDLGLSSLRRNHLCSLGRWHQNGRSFDLLLAHEWGGRRRHHFTLAMAEGKQK